MNATNNVKNFYSFFSPRCGIVALCMALNCLKIECTVDELMKQARKLNFTKKGEIFDGNDIIFLRRKILL